MSWNIGLKDKIGTLSHSAGSITLAPSIITIGGRQYRTLASISRTIATDVTLAANTRYMIYAQVVSGVVNLRISTAVRSSYLISNPPAELVGAFISNGLASIAFGSFLTIVGKPISLNKVPFTPTGSFTANTVYSGLYEVDGANANFEYLVNYTGAASPATQLTLGTPANLVIDLGIDKTLRAQMSDRELGIGTHEDTGVQTYSVGLAYGSTTLFVAWTKNITGANVINSGGITPTFPFTIGSSDRTSYAVRDISITGWSVKSLVDL